MKKEHKKMDDTLSAVSKISEVNEEPALTPKKKIIIWSIAGLMGIFVLISMFFGGNKPRQDLPESNKPINDYHIELQDNLAKLKKANDIAERQLNKKFSGTVKKKSEFLSKEYIARQNAPTNIYVAGELPQKTHLSQKEKNGLFSGDGLYKKFTSQRSRTNQAYAEVIPNPNNSIVSGEFIHAILETNINSDLPGMVRAVVSEPVYAYVGNQLLIPSGSRLIGQYSSATLHGINRVMVIWNRIILPSGIAVQIKSPGTDMIGRAGNEADSIDRHFLKRFGQATLLSLIAAGVSSDSVGSLEQYNSAAAYRGSIAQSFQQSAQESLRNQLPIKPTLHVHQGTRVVVFAAQDLVFHNVLRGKDD